MQPASVAVPVGPCQCSGTPHEDGDVVELRPRLGLAQGVQIQTAIIMARNEGTPPEVVTGVLAEQYLRVGVMGWNFTSEGGKPLPVTPGNIEERLLSDFSVGTLVSDAADELYAATVVLPLVERAARSSPTTTTNGSTSATNGGSSKRPKRSKPSSTSTSTTAVTATTTG
jgi:hypothetical protein